MTEAHNFALQMIGREFDCGMVSVFVGFYESEGHVYWLTTTYAHDRKRAIIGTRQRHKTRTEAMRVVRHYLHGLPL